MATRVSTVWMLSTWPVAFYWIPVFFLTHYINDGGYWSPWSEGDSLLLEFSSNSMGTRETVLPFCPIPTYIPQSQVFVSFRSFGWPVDRRKVQRQLVLNPFHLAYCSGPQDHLPPPPGFELSLRLLFPQDQGFDLGPTSPRACHTFRDPRTWFN